MTMLVDVYWQETERYPVIYLEGNTGDAAWQYETNARIEYETYLTFLMIENMNDDFHSQIKQEIKQ